MIGHDGRDVTHGVSNIIMLQGPGGGGTGSMPRAVTLGLGGGIRYPQVSNTLVAQAEWRRQ